MSQASPLRTQSYWTRTSNYPKFDQLRGEQRVDVAIIGAGITGLTAAYLLKKAGRTVAVVDQHEVAGGESGHTTGHLTEIVDARYCRLAKDFGPNGARQVFECSRSAMNQLARLSSDLQRDFQIDCDFKKVPAFLYASTPDQVSELKEEFNVLQSLGVEASWIEEAPLPFNTFGAVRIENQAIFHPRKYLLGLAQAVNTQGSFVYERCRALELIEGEPCRVVTEHGTVLSNHVVMATHTPSFNRMVMHTKLAAYRSYAIAAKLKRPPTEDGLYWDLADPYHYVRKHADVWIIGGEDHKTGMEKDTDERFAALDDYARDQFGAQASECHWSGQILETVDGLPYFGQNPGSSHTYVGTGYSGNGLTWGTAAGMLISEEILGRSSPWAKLFSPRRITPRASARDFLLENKDVPICLLKDTIKPAEAKSLADIAPGEGKLMRQGLSKIAVYRDENDRLHAVSSICPHMGCHVHFNSSEKSWDCPCHGSRFSVDGELLNGPAIEGLAPKQI